MNNFDDIRPLLDSEIPAAMHRLAQWELMPQIIRFIYPDADIESVRQHIESIQTSYELQSTVMNDAIRRIIATTTDGFSHSGLTHLRRGQPYLFISNHRDITLDAFLLQHLLIENGYDTSYIVFGQNLISSSVLADAFRANKLIQMPRGGNPRSFYDSLHHLSTYLHHIVVEERHSAWIAQKNGRAKDGHDTTAAAMLKMLCLANDADPSEQLARLHLVPISISYEWDPCDAMKAVELYKIQAEGHYDKAADEDFRSVVAGIIGAKGHVHLHIGNPLRAADLKPTDKTHYFDQVAALLDRRIQHGYRLMPSNYAAYSLLHGKSLHGRYTKHTEAQLLQRIDELPHPDMRRLMLEAYAAPVVAKETMRTATEQN